MLKNISVEFWEIFFLSIWLWDFHISYTTFDKELKQSTIIWFVQWIYTSKFTSQPRVKSHQVRNSRIFQYMINNENSRGPSKSLENSRGLFTRMAVGCWVRQKSSKNDNFWFFLSYPELVCRRIASWMSFMMRRTPHQDRKLWKVA